MLENQKFKEFIPYIIIMFISFIICQFIGLSIVSGKSMEPTYYNNDVLVHSNVPYIFGNPKINDIVILDVPQNVFGHDELIIKRVVALPGDTIEIKDNKFYRNSVEVKEDYINEQMNLEEYKNMERYTLEDDEYFVMGDNRNHSADSRYFGPVPKEYISSKIICDNENFSGFMKSFYKLIGKIK